MRRLAWYAIGCGLSLTPAAMLSWGPDLAGYPAADGHWLVFGSAAAFGAGMYSAERMARVDRIGAGNRIALVSMLSIFALLAVVLLFTRTYYSRTFLSVMLLMSIGWLLLTRQLQQRLWRPAYAYMPGQVSDLVMARVAADWLPLHEAQMLTQPVSAVIADYSSTDPDWQRLMSAYVSQEVPLISGAELEEAVTGRVRLERLSQRHVGEFQPHMVYEPLKRALDVLLVLAVAPLALLPAGLTALVIRLESRGPILFSQERIGRGNRVFRMIKFRSMTVDSNVGASRFTTLNDPRVTRVGRWLRRTRLDELPQLWNVLRGEMSLVGPRPEQVTFVRQFEQSIPFYRYRHMLRPGITGWAQVTQGYVAGEDATRRKLAYDLYYVRHCSLWLDLVILIRTVRILATGFGAR